MVALGKVASGQYRVQKGSEGLFQQPCRSLINHEFNIKFDAFDNFVHTINKSQFGSLRCEGSSGQWDERQKPCVSHIILSSSVPVYTADFDLIVVVDTSNAVSCAKSNLHKDKITITQF